jgi:hypothetical protein
LADRFCDLCDLIVIEVKLSQVRQLGNRFWDLCDLDLITTEIKLCQI